MLCNLVQIYQSWRNLLPWLKMEAAGFSERLAYPYQTTWHHIPKNSSLYNSSCFKDVRDTKLERQQSSASGTVYNSTRYKILTMLDKMSDFVWQIYSTVKWIMPAFPMTINYQTQWGNGRYKHGTWHYCSQYFNLILVAVRLHCIWNSIYCPIIQNSDNSLSYLKSRNLWPLSIVHSAHLKYKFKRSILGTDSVCWDIMF